MYSDVPLRLPFKMGPRFFCATWNIEILKTEIALSA